MTNTSTRPTRCVLIVAISLSMGTLKCPAAIIRHDRDADAHRKLAERKAFRCVGRAGVKLPGRPVRFGGTAVLVSPLWVLTAGHVMLGQPVPRLRFEFADEIFRATQCVHHPDFDEGAFGLGRIPKTAGRVVDLALVKLDRAVEHVTPATRYRGDREVGQSVVTVGYGIVGNGRSGAQHPPMQVRRAGTNVIDAAGGKIGDITFSERVLFFDFDDPDTADGNQLGDPEPTDLEATIAKGDSGGGWFIEDGGSLKLTAITSGNMPHSADQLNHGNRVFLYYGGIAAGMRVSTANTWIDSVLASE